MAYDEARERVVIYGGGSYIGQVSEWDGSDWTIIAATPGNRSEHAMVYDRSRQRIMMFGGNNLNSDRSDTWEWDGITWVNRNPPANPGGRRAHAMAFDTHRGRAVLFGGRSGGGTVFSDTWEWNGTTWLNTGVTSGPSARIGHAMAYDEERERVVLFGGSTGSGETWEWDGASWERRIPETSPSGRSYHAMTYDPVRKKMILFGGNDGALRNDTWEWDGENWNMIHGGLNHRFNTAEKSDGIWNFTKVRIDPGITVTFDKNDLNTPIHWIASESVVINGTLNLDGESAKTGSVMTSNQAKGGPGGFGGGMGGNRQDNSGDFAGTQGGGLGGGAAGVTEESDGSNGAHQGAYGNVYLLPLVGGSGGGGGGSAISADGPNGGGGGGSILIASSRDITLAGAIYARGGNRQSRARSGGGTQFSGFGSGGSVVLVADRVSGNGVINALGGDNSASSQSAGRIRIEGFERSLGVQNLSPLPAQSVPILQRFEAISGNASLRITHVGGNAVFEPLRGRFSTPDVIFNSSGVVQISVVADNVPDGTIIGGRITIDGNVITLPPSGAPAVQVSGGTALLESVVPAGLGKIEVFTLTSAP